MYLQGIALVWESYKLDPYVQRLAEVVFSFQERVEDLLVVEEQLDVDVRSLETCPYSANTFADILDKIQHAVDDLSLRQYSNLHIWVTRLDEEVSDKWKWSSVWKTIFDMTATIVSSVSSTCLPCCQREQQCPLSDAWIHSHSSSVCPLVACKL